MRNRRIRELRGYKYDTVDMMQFGVVLPDCKGNKYVSIKNGFLYFNPHYAYDGSSVPFKRFVPKWLWDFDKFCKIASLVHDGICQLMREYFLDKKHKEYADELYRRMSIEGGMSKWDANTRYWFLRKFPNKGITKEKNPRGKIIEI